MTSSLVGSEMCIRDRKRNLPLHLWTLPTILSLMAASADGCSAASAAQQADVGGHHDGHDD
eukprot:10571589-Prorocentrum_lima.AAC.1